MPSDTENKLQKALQEIEQLKKENAELRRIVDSQQTRIHSDRSNTKRKKINERIKLFRSLFKGREDVFAERWEMNNGRSGYSPARKHNQLRSLTNQDVYDHLSGKKTIGLYPVLHDNFCWFLVVDFDKGKWQEDAYQFVQTCKKFNLPISVEISRSGNGCHVWFFFRELVTAGEARKVGHILLSETNKKSGSLASYDRMFPNQDIVTKGKMGNLIALPLQGKPRKLNKSVFVDDNFCVYDDQWAYLLQIKRIGRKDVKAIISQNQRNVTVKEQPEDFTTLPDKVQGYIKNGIHISKNKLPHKLIHDMERLAIFSNPEFYKAKNKRLPTKGIPRKIDCSNGTDQYLTLPRGCLEDLQNLMERYSIKLDLDDKTNLGSPLNLEFKGKLSIHQEEALHEMAKHRTGILSAATGFGKTVVAASLIAHRKVNTLIIVHRTYLMEQWKERLTAFLNTDTEMIGQVGGGKSAATGKVDVATIQSLKSGESVKETIKQYGQVIVDECHHIPAVSFEKVLNEAEASFVHGLTATLKRKDGHDPIIRMQFGTIRYKISAKDMAKVRPIKHVLVPRYTRFNSDEKDFQSIYTEITTDNDRNDMIFNDVLNELEKGAAPIILTERVDHVKKLEEMFSGFTKNLFVLMGELTKKEERERLNKLDEIPDHEERLIIATGKYIGEGFDNARLDTMFLVMPFSWEGILHQYVGRMHRLHESKSMVKVYDYVDHRIPMLARMYNKRQRGYQSLGYVNKEADLRKFTQQMNLF